MAQIKAVGFDLGGVLLTSERQKLYRYCQEAFGAPIDEIEVAIDAHLMSLERGDIEIKQFWQKVTKSLGVDYEPSKDMQLWSKNFTENTPIHHNLLDLSDRLRKRGIKTGILSNTHAEHIEINEHRHIFEHFDVAVMSSQIHAAKPEPRAYLELCRQLKVLPSVVVFIDDLAENVAGAEAVGMKGVEFHGYNDLIERLNKLGVETN